MKMLKIIFVSLFACMFMLNENVEGMIAAQAVARLKDIYSAAANDSGVEIYQEYGIRDFQDKKYSLAKAMIENLRSHVVVDSNHLIYNGQANNPEKTCIVLPVPQNHVAGLPGDVELCRIITNLQVEGAQLVSEVRKDGDFIIDIKCTINHGYIGRVIPHGPTNIPVQWVMIKYKLRDKIISPMSIYPCTQALQGGNARRVRQVKKVELNFTD